MKKFAIYQMIRCKKAFDENNCEVGLIVKFKNYMYEVCLGLQNNVLHQRRISTSNQPKSKNKHAPYAITFDKHSTVSTPLEIFSYHLNTQLIPIHKQSY